MNNLHIIVKSIVYNAQENIRKLSKNQYGRTNILVLIY